MDPAPYLAPLAEVSSETAELVKKIIAGKELSPDVLAVLAEEGVFGASLERRFGNAYAEGLARLAVDGDTRGFRLYRQLTHRTAREGAAFGYKTAQGLFSAVTSREPKARAWFLKAAYTMLHHGAHTLARNTEAFVWLLEEGDAASAILYEKILHSVYGRPLSYHQALLFTEETPRMVRKLPRSRRAAILEQVLAVARANALLVPDFSEGLFRGLTVLPGPDLAQFVAEALARYEKKPEAGRRFLTLESGDARRMFESAQKSVALAQVRSGISRYLAARAGLSVAVLPLSSLPSSFLPAVNQEAFSVTDGAAVYLPEEIGVYPDKEKNRELFKTLARLEAGVLECGTYGLDVERAEALFRDQGLNPLFPGKKPGEHDIDALARAFPVPALFLDLFSAFENGRALAAAQARYPNILAFMRPYLTDEADRVLSIRSPFPIMTGLYLALAGVTGSGQGPVNQAMEVFNTETRNLDRPESSALAAAKVYPQWLSLAREALGAEDDSKLAELYRSPETLFGRRVMPGLAALWQAPLWERVEKLKKRLASLGVFVYAQDLQKLMRGKPGSLNEEDVRCIGRPMPGGNGEMPEKERIAKALKGETSVGQGEDEPDSDNVFRYPEWSDAIADYLPDFARVVASQAMPGPSSVYDDVLVRRRGLVRHLRKSFELLKPQGLVLLRRWVEGDDFDYRALVDYAVDRKSGRTPSERLYVKRVKNRRDVAALLLVDLSRSTRNTVPGTARSVLDVEKEAVVLFCEALSSVGDPFSVAGFSGAGNLRVDYLTIKGFDEALGEEVKSRIGGLTPLRNTRMGAAVRHATHLLATRENKVKLLILLGDGFPNDLEYKGAQAVNDTRIAIREARSRGIHMHAITVNLSDAARLDELYGEVHHNLIADVIELPEKLPRIYRALTR